MCAGNPALTAVARPCSSSASHAVYIYAHSPVSLPDGTPPPLDEVMTYVQTARPGSRAPHVWLAPDRSIIDLFGKDFVLLRFGADAPAGDAFADAARRHQVPFRVVDIDSEEARMLYERRLVLVRPDGQVAWRADTVPADPLQVIDVVRGAAMRQVAPCRRR